MWFHLRDLSASRQSWLPFCRRGWLLDNFAGIPTLLPCCGKQSLKRLLYPCCGLFRLQLLELEHRRDHPPMLMLGLVFYAASSLIKGWLRSSRDSGPTHAYSVGRALRKYSNGCQPMFLVSKVLTQSWELSVKSWEQFSFYQFFCNSMPYYWKSLLDQARCFHKVPPIFLTDPKRYLCPPF